MSPIAVSLRIELLESVEQLRDQAMDVLRPIVAVKSLGAEGKAFEQGFEHGDEENYLPTL